MRDLRQIDVAGAAVTDTVPLEVLAAVDRGRNPEAVTKDTLYVRERVLCRFCSSRVGGGRGAEGGMGFGCRVRLALVSAGSATADGEGAQCARVGARGLGGGCVRTCRTVDPVCEGAGGRAMAVWLVAPVWERGFEEVGAREVRIPGADADVPLLRPPLPFSFLGRPLPSPPLPLPFPLCLCRGCSETLSEANDMARGKITVMANFRYVHSLARLGLSRVLLCFFFFSLLAAAQRAEAGLVERQRISGGEWVLEGRLLTARCCTLPAVPPPAPACSSGFHVPPLCCLGMRSPRPWRLTRRSRGRPDGCLPPGLGRAASLVVWR